MNIVITGSLGHISKPLTKTLIANGHQVTVISSSAERQQEIEQLGAIAAIGSVDDASFLTSAFSGADAVYCMIPPNFREEKQVEYYTSVGKNYAAAATKAGVKKIVELSSYGAHLESGTGYIVGSNRVEKVFDQLEGVAVTHIRPGYFYYNLLGFIKMIKALGFISANYGGEDKLPFVAPVDIATAVAEELEAPGTGRKIRYVASDYLSCNEVAGILGEAIGIPDLQWKTVSNDDMQKGLEANGLPAHIAAMLVELGAAAHRGALREDYDKQEVVLGKTKIKEFAKEFAVAFAGK